MIEKLAELSIKGLLTDGAHHKQWYLEQILTTIAAEQGVSLLDIKSQIYDEGYGDWDEGIPP